MQTRSKTMEYQEEAQAQPWPLSADFPDAALEAVLAALPRPAKRWLRATCTAARTAVDASLTSLNATKDQSLLPAAAPRLARLQSLKCFTTEPDEVASLLAALPLLPATLTRLELSTSDAPLQQAQFDALLAAIAARGSLESLELHGYSTKCATTVALLALGARLPALTEFRFCAWDSFKGKLSVLHLPWHQLQAIRMSASVVSLLPQLLAREAPALRCLELSSSSPLDVRALSGAPWFAQLTRLVLDVPQGPETAALFVGAPTQLALQELRVSDTYHGLPLAVARRLAATSAPLRRLELYRSAAGVVAAIAGAPWASSLQALQLRRADEFGAPAAAGAAAAVLAAAPLGALTNLELTDADFGADAAPLSRLLAAPWAPGLRELVLGAPWDYAVPTGAAVAALAAAPLPALRVLGLQRLRLDAAALSGALVAAPWLQRLEQLSLDDEQLSLQDFAALAAVHMPSLCELKVSSGGLSASALEALAAAPWLPQLQRLRLGGVVSVAVYAAIVDAVDRRGVCGDLTCRGGAVDLDGLFGEEEGGEEEEEVELFWGGGGFGDDLSDNEDWPYEALM